MLVQFRQLLLNELFIFHGEVYRKVSTDLAELFDYYGVTERFGMFDIVMYGLTG